MPTSRLEAFSDGVLAIIITIMVLKLAVPRGDDVYALVSRAGTGLLTYLLSFAYIGIYWNNHHHMLQLTRRVTGGTLWANLHLLFWLSLLPFTTEWMDSTGLARAPVVAYGVNLLAAAVAYVVMQTVIIRSQRPDSALALAIGPDLKGKMSPVLYLAGIASALFGGGQSTAWIYVGIGFFVGVALLWFVPDRRIERTIAEAQAAADG